MVQEVTEMRRLGMDANIAVRKVDLTHLRDLYQDIDDVNGIFIGFENDNLIHISEKFDVVVATIFTSVSLLKKIIDVNPHILPAYYAQDYEPMFFPEESDNWHVARESYTLIPNSLVFAKTHWIADKIKQEHSVKVFKVSPSIDHSTYKPTKKVDDNFIHISAMIRPQTPRRGAERTMRLFSRLAKIHKDKIIFHLFGCESNDERFKSLQCDFEFENRGILKRPEVASLLSQVISLLIFLIIRRLGVRHSKRWHVVRQLCCQYMVGETSMLETILMRLLSILSMRMFALIE